ncbi:hypothetical protein G7075_04700 [Phycicoccus sp. HDW14]|uniref:hypothetical protein n=1 Tax=Phycicoccus sp. HDW14 TaxID=2714941 RepID=UPI001409404D|nr:hypothetical protein [Phycicoccus sp. HDW14]QIM20611.1 hypothetical protein G7075_04700 [Phycicoccus sp. HDW14]
MTDRTVPGLPDAGKLHPYNHRPGADDIVVDVIRPGDLVALTVTVRGATLEPPVTKGPKAARRPHSVVVAGPTASLVVDMPFQHAHEEASYESGGTPKLDPMHPDREPTTTTPSVVLPAHPPVQYRPARGSRLVFTLAEGERIDLTSAGILGRLPGSRPPCTRAVRPRAGGPRPTSCRPGSSSSTRSSSSRCSAASSRSCAPTTCSSPAAAAPAPWCPTPARSAASRRWPPTTGSSRSTPAAAASASGAASTPPRSPDGSATSSAAASGKGSSSAEAPTAARRPWTRRPSRPLPAAGLAHLGGPLGPRRRTRAGQGRPGHLELWHTRLDTGRRTDEDLLWPGNPADAESRVIRAVWARDRDDVSPFVWRDPGADRGDTDPLGPDTVTSTTTPTNPFLGSLDRADRHRLVRQTAEVWPASGRKRIDPVPVGADKLWLTALGAWLDLHGHWDTKPYSDELIASILAWDHIATAGRDQYVRVVYPGYLFPLGQPTVRVKLTQRSIRPQDHPTAGLVQRQFLVVIDPFRDHTAVHGFPFLSTRIGPGATPALDPPGDDPVTGLSPSEAFWPRVGGKTFAWKVDGIDRDGRPQTHPMPMVWVAEHVGPAAQLRALEKAYAEDPRRVIDLGGQHVAFAPAGPDGDARVETRALRVLGTARKGGSSPRMSTADVVLPAAQAVAGTGATRITYFPEYRAKGFTPGNAGRVWASTLLPGLDTSAEYKDDLATTGPARDEPQELPRIGFGGAPGDVGSDQAGGFVQPNLTIAGLSQSRGRWATSRPSRAARSTPPPSSVPPCPSSSASSS